jgi:mannose-6-phosphate isomerase-like protein (cupin superfamily)
MDTLTDPIPTDIKPEFFNMKIHLMEEGRDDREIFRTGAMNARMKTYASGGENGLHAHMDEDHTFIIMEGSATFYGPNGEEKEVGKHEGIMLPAGSFYYFNASGGVPLVLLRLASPVSGNEHLSKRMKPDGTPLLRHDKGNKRAAPVIMKDAFFE